MVQHRWMTLIGVLCSRLTSTRFMIKELLEGQKSRRVMYFNSFYGKKFSSLFSGDVFYQEENEPSYKQTNGGGTYYSEEDFGILKLLCNEFYKAMYYVSEVVVLPCF